MSVNAMTEEYEHMLADWEAQEDDGDMCDGCHGCDEDMLPIPAEAFADAGILYDIPKR